MKNHFRFKVLESRPLAYFFAQAGVGTGFSYLTSGVYLSGLAILMGAGDILVSYLSVMIQICGVLILGFSAYLERFQSHKKLTMWLTVLSRLMPLFIVAIPAVVPRRLWMIVFIPTVMIAFTLQAQTTVVLNQWMLGFVDPKTSGRDISRRQTLALAVTVVLSMAGGRWMDFMEGSYPGFFILFLAAGGMAGAELALLAKIPDNKKCQQPSSHKGFWKLVKEPLRDVKFRRFVLYIAVFYLVLNIADSFTTVYLMKYLNLPYQTVTGTYLLLSLPQVVLLGIWGKISDRYGHQFTLRSSIWLFAGETGFLFLASSKTALIWIPLAFLTASVANSGFTVAVFNRRYELMPEKNRIVYDNFYTAAIGLGVVLGPLTGGIIKAILENCPAVTSVMPMGGIRLLYLISTVGILLIQVIHFKRLHRAEGMLMKKERGESI